ncbi:MAG TPA: hypothetical protein PLV58_10650 [Campylobacterales bacterium]|nr:hypothetical protein [Campylobacterales bacterium]
MVVVSDSTTLIVLSNMERFDLLINLFAKVYIPQAVFEETTSKDGVRLPKFIEVCLPKHDKDLKAIKLLLDEGESEAVILAIQKNLTLIIDEKKGREIAKNMGLKIIGLVGVVYLNIARGFLSVVEAKKFLELANANGFRISQRLVDGMFNSVDCLK